MRKASVYVLLVTVLLVGVIATPAAAIVKVPPATQVYILDPRYSVPAVIHPGGTFNLSIRSETGDPVDVVEVVLIGLNSTVTTQVQALASAGDVFRFEVQTPSSVTPGLYDVVASVKVGGTDLVLREPRAVWVLEGEPDALTIVHVGDSILGGSAIGGKYTWEMYEAAVVFANALQPDLVVMVGDDVDVGNDVKSLQQFYAVTNELMVPSFIIPGNHDWAQVNSMDDFVNEYYGRWVGPGNWVREVGKFVFIGLDGGAENYLRDDQLDWLESLVQHYEGTGKTVVIVIHPPFIMASGDYYGAPEEIPDKYPDVVHKSWVSHRDSYVRFLHILNDYECVKFVIAGDTHRDAVVRYNDKVTMITVTAIGHPNVYKYRGFRAYTIYANGTVKYYPAAGRDPLGPEASFNTDLVDTTVNYDAEMTMFGYYIVIDPKFELDLQNVPIYFFLNASLDPSQYRIYGDTDKIKEIEHYTYGDYLIYKAIVDLRNGTENTFVVAAGEDNAPPTVKISLYSPKTPIAGKQPITVTITAQDEGFGIKSVKLLYRPAGETEWIPLKAVRSTETSFRTTVPPLNVPYVELKAVAVDWAGQEAESDVIKVEYAGYKPETTTTTTTAPPTTTTSVTTTTTTVTTTPPQTTTQETTTTTTATTTQQPTTTTSPTGTTTPQAAPNTMMYVGIAIVVLIIVVGGILVFKKK